MRGTRTLPRTTASCVDILKEAVGVVVPGSVQFKAQHKREALTSGLLLLIRALAQQSILPLMWHSLSPECVGTPASVLPVSSSRRKRDVSRFFIAGLRLY
jgi:hypothetical protein